MTCKTLLLLVAWLTTLIGSGAAISPCLPGTVAFDVVTTADVQRLTDELNCTGRGNFYITWYSSLQIGKRIDVSSETNITVTGSGFPTIRGAVNDDNDAGGSVTTGTATGIFSVSKSSTLRLNNLALEGGYASSGGAVSVTSSSFLVVSGSTFANNHAWNNGGDTTSEEMSNLSSMVNAISLDLLLHESPKTNPS